MYLAVGAASVVDICQDSGAVQCETILGCGHILCKYVCPVIDDEAENNQVTIFMPMFSNTILSIMRCSFKFAWVKWKRYIYIFSSYPCNATSAKVWNYCHENNFGFDNCEWFDTILVLWHCQIKNKKYKTTYNQSLVFHMIESFENMYVNI